MWGYFRVTINVRGGGPGARAHPPPKKKYRKQEKKKKKLEIARTAICRVG